MSAGTRQQPEKNLDKEFKPKSYQRISRKTEKIIQNRKNRRLAKINPEDIPRKKYNGWEW